MKFAVVLVPLLWLTQIALVSSNTYGHLEVTASDHSEGASKKGENAKKDKGYNVYESLKKTGKSKKHDEERAKKGFKVNELKKTEDKEKGGKKNTFFSEGHHKSSHSGEGGSKHGLKHASGAKKKKTNYEKGFREKYHKDELMHHHSFFHIGQRSGDYSIFGKKGAKHAAFVSAKEVKKTNKKGEEKSQHAKKGKKAGGHNTEGKKGHRNSKQDKTHYEKGNSYGQKGGKKGGKHYKYKSSTK